MICLINNDDLIGSKVIYPTQISNFDLEHVENEFTDPLTNIENHSTNQQRGHDAYYVAGGIGDESLPHNDSHIEVLG